MVVFATAVFGTETTCLSHGVVLDGGHCGLSACCSHENPPASFFLLLNSWIFYLHRCLCSASCYTVNLCYVVLSLLVTIIIKITLQFGSLRRLGHCSFQFYRFMNFYTEYVLFCVSASYLGWFPWIIQVFIKSCSVEYMCFLCVPSITDCSK